MTTKNTNTNTNTNSTNVPATNTNTNAPSIDTLIKGAFRAAGIVIPTGKDAANNARKELQANGAAYIPMGDDANTLLIIANEARANIAEAENAGYRASVLLASIDASGLYGTALNANGKPYRSVAALAKDLFPTLQHSTLMNYIGTGRNIYLPALNGKFTKATNSNLLKLAPSVALNLKAVIADDKTQKAAIDAINAEMKAKGRVSKKRAMEIAQEVKGTGTGRNDNTDAAAKNGDAKAAEQVAQMSEQDAYNAILTRALQWIPQALRDVHDGDITVTIPSAQVPELKKYVTDAVKSTDTAAKNRLIKALAKVIIG